MMIQVPVLYSKIHRATVTQADLDYVGSLTIDADLMALADLKEFQQIDVYNITSGSRFSTYAITGRAGSGTIQVNGAAAHLARKGDLIIICAYATVPLEMRDNWQPKLVFVDECNVPRPELAPAFSRG